MVSILSKLKQFKDLRAQGKKMQTLLAGATATGTGGGGQVVVTLDGQFNITTLNIGGELLAPNQKLKLETALKDAYHEALKKMQRTVMGKMQASGDLKLPGM